MARRPRFAVVGAGMAGILSAVKLGEAGFDDVVVYEKADRLGGTWRENTYPGVACDVPSHLYSYSFAPNAEWTYTFSPGAEIRDYLEDVATRFGVDKRIRSGAEVTSLAYQPDGCWRVGTADGGRDEADVVIAATGVLHHPRFPDIEGVDDFGGAVFHSARWDHSVGLDGARLGVVGTGSSAVQIVGAVVDRVAELHLFQRTAQWILPVPNNPITDADRERYRDDSAAIEALRDQLDKTFTEGFANAVVDKDSPQMQILEGMCRANLENSVTDPELRERLRPSYRAACKRLVISPNFYDAVQRANARVVTEAIERVEKGGVRTTDGRLHELDVLVLATGFRVDRFMRPIDVTGRGGVSLDSVWANRPSAYLSVSIPDFPNLFMLNGPNGPVGNFSLIDVAETQFAYIMQLVDGLAAGRWREVSATRQAMEQFEAARVERAKNTIWVTGCRSWYLDDRGIPAVWPWSFDRFREEMSRPKLEHYELVG
ncbi:MAG: NAD(P)/FAD-dependent oxidoreductase [Acidimicrobiia bacterium]|nr:NAD(P)/FAD-dependent oxidoreductase [Acidimicrobiia bacterium]